MFKIFNNNRIFAKMEKKNGKRTEIIIKKTKKQHLKTIKIQQKQ